MVCLVVFCFSYVWTIVAPLVRRCCFVVPLTWHRCYFAFFLFNIIDVLRSSYLKLLFYSSFLCVVVLLLLNAVVVLRSFCSKLLLYSFCSMCWCVQHVDLILLFDTNVPLILLHLLFYSFYSMLLLILFNAIVPCSFKHLITPMILLLLVPFVWCCSYCYYCFWLVLPPFIFLQVWRSYPHLSSLGQI